MAVCVWVCVSVCECVCQKISMYVSARSTAYEGKRFSVCMYAIVCFQLKVESVCLWENSHVHQGDKILRCVCVCVCVCVCLICAGVCVRIHAFLRSARNLPSRRGGRGGDRERLRMGNKSNNSTIFVVYGSEIEFVLQSCSPAVSQRVTSFQLRWCFNLRNLRRTRAHLPRRLTPKWLLRSH